MGFFGFFWVGFLMPTLQPTYLHLPTYHIFTKAYKNRRKRQTEKSGYLSPLSIYHLSPLCQVLNPTKYGQLHNSTVFCNLKGANRVCIIWEGSSRNQYTLRVIQKEVLNVFWIRIRKFFGLSDSDQSFFVRIRILSSTYKKVWKTLISTILRLLFDFYL